MKSKTTTTTKRSSKAAGAGKPKPQRPPLPLDADGKLVRVGSIVIAMDMTARVSYVANGCAIFKSLEGDESTGRHYCDQTQNLHVIDDPPEQFDSEIPPI